MEELRCRLADPAFVRAYGMELAKSALALAVSRARRETGLTQEELANKIGHSQPYIAQLESGDANPTIGAAGAILAAMGRRMWIQTGPLGGEEPEANAVQPPTAFSTQAPYQIAEHKLDGYSI